ncbi:helix-turn-helix transcriptional regulator [Nonomuraea soli]|uniref:DNA-binding CsgD family transcriptional regulator/tetratricopeptide (TPR) repeat protein n=1 Tax=Nonomuraea soli TaxID=1032476 RepID=A0A7W0CIG5_9ACTN|nr:LuxR C-terminal-related transcriptional regulator [Nonomuraea soli]MBA2891751.1 DNA-binding CsgD family transcriptional regulator/tetratricopeptide (TPR) repeat protein [Nonomuraea soli]
MDTGPWAGRTTGWPFVGRVAERERALTILRRSNIVIAGAAGVGKSRLAAELAASFQAPVRVRGTHAAGALPLGAFAPLLPGGEPGANPLRWAADAILARRPSLLVVDDAHLLDASSAALAHQLSARVRVLATVRTGQECPDSVAALWEDDRGARLDLDPLGQDETAELLSGVLGGQVDRAAAVRLHELSQGNALLLRELVAAALEGGVLARPGQVWRLDGEVPRAPRLIEVIERRMGRYGDAVTAVLELVALAEPIGLAPLGSLAGHEAVEEAEERGLIQVVMGDRRTEVRLAHPLYGEVVRARAPVLRLRRRYRELAEAVEATGARRREDVLRVAAWRLESGTTTRPAPLLRAARTAWAAHDYPLGLRLAEAAWDNSSGPDVPHSDRADMADDSHADVPDGYRADAAIMYGTLLNYSGRAEEALAVVESVPGEGCDERRRTELTLTRAWSLAFGQVRMDEAVGLLTRVREEITQRSLRQDLSCLLLVIVGGSGDLDRILSLAEALLAEPPETAAVKAQALNCRAATLATLGRYGEALADIRDALDDLAEWHDAVPVIVQPLYSNWALTCLMSADLEGADDVLDRMESLLGRGRGSIYAADNIAILRSAAARMRGRFAEARRHVAPPYEPKGDDVLSGMVHIERAHVLALTGDAVGARVAFDAGVGGQSRHGSLHLMWRYLTEPWLLAAEGDTKGAAAFALGTAAHGRGLGLLPFVTAALHTVARLGYADLAAEHLPFLEEGPLEGPYAPVVLAHCRAAAAGDGAALEEVAAAFERLGCIPFAAEALAQAAAAWERSGRATASRVAAGRAWTLAARCEGLTTPAVASLTAPGLTRREAEIARLACAGLSSKQIAEQLVLSTRTVDNHLQSVYGKLGVTSRAELKRILV